MELKMRFLDRLALNRLISILTGFILAIVKILAQHNHEEIDNVVPIPPKENIIKRITKKTKNILNRKK
jgi:F0F1-type ATP synthase delta subunit